MIDIVRLPTLDAWADHVSARFISTLTSVSDSTPTPTPAPSPALGSTAAATAAAAAAAVPARRICLATGNTPVPVYDRIVGAVRTGALSFAHIDAFLLDEFGGVPRDAEGRCDMMLRRALIDHVDLPTSHFHTIDTDADTPDLAAICEAYDAAAGVLDLTILGIGTNGHIGMNEPDSPADSRTRRVNLSRETQESARRYFGGLHTPTWGVTMGIATILRSREIWLLATGRSKAAIVRRLLTEPVSPALPASLLHQHPRCVLFIDADADADAQAGADADTGASATHGA